VAADDRKPDEAGLQVYIGERFHPTVQVQLSALPSLPKGPGGKLTPYLSMVE
jgi:hypothetical protein